MSDLVREIVDDYLCRNSADEAVRRSLTAVDGLRPATKGHPGPAWAPVRGIARRAARRARSGSGLMKVIDAGVILGLMLPLPFSDQATEAILESRRQGEELFAPALLEYEVCSALRRALSRGLLDDQVAAKALDLLARCTSSRSPPPLRCTTGLWPGQVVSASPRPTTRSILALAEELWLQTADHRRPSGQVCSGVGRRLGGIGRPERYLTASAEAVIRPPVLHLTLEHLDLPKPSSV